MQTQVSIIVLSYNPSWEKMRYTLRSIVCQRGIDFEILIADDGSEEDYRENIEAFFREMVWSQYQFVKAERNQGTVKNILNAFNHSTGEYIYLTSPGDFIYDAYVMRDFYVFAKQRQCDMCFGNAVYYTPKNQTVVSVINSPGHLSLFHRDISGTRKQLELFCDSVLGASFFRSRESVEKYIGGIAHVSKYVEDYTSSCYAVLDGADIRHYDRTMLFYEYESGISRSPDSLWKQRLENDYIGTLCFLKKKYPKNPVLDLMYYYKTSKSLWLSRFYRLFRHPWLSVNLLINKHCPFDKTACNSKLQRRLEDIIK